MSITRRLQSIAGRDLEIVTWSPHVNSQDTLVFLHDGLGSCDTWRGFPRQVGRWTSRRILLFSRHGHGRSAASPFPRTIAFLHREAKEILPAVLRAANVGRFILVGHSDGATIALLYAALASKANLAGVVAISPHVFIEPMCRSGLLAAQREFLHGDLAARLRLFHGSNAQSVFWKWHRAWNSDRLSGWDIRMELGFITTPVLIVQSTADPFGTLAQANAIAECTSGPCEMCIVSGESHAPHQQRSGRTIEAISQFVQRYR